MAKPLPLPRKRVWDGPWQRRLAAVLGALLLILVAALMWLDTGAGHRFLVSRIVALRPPSGLRIEVQDIEGSIYRKAVLRGVALSDAKGRFFEAPRVELDWWPIAWLSNRLDIDRLVIPRATLHKLPRLNPSTRQGPILPGFDIRLMQFSVGQLSIDKGVAGRAQTASLSGDADIRGGRAIIDLSVHVTGSADSLQFALDSRPDADKFDLDVTVNAPAGGVLAKMAGLRQDGNLRIQGKGSWTRWDGHLAATLDARPAADLTLAARRGAYSASGSIEGAVIAGNGLVRRLSDPRLTVRADGTLIDRIVKGRVSLRSQAMDVSANGAIDLRNNALDNLLFDVKLIRPGALLKNMGGRDVAARIRLDGPMARPGFEYLLTARQIAFGKTLINDVRIDGKGRRAAEGPALIPLRLRARTLDGQGQLVGGIVRNFALDGVLQVRGQQIISNPMPLRSDKLRGKLIVLADLRTGRYDLGLDGQISGLAIRGLGIVDVTSKLRAVPGPNGAFGLSGNALARMRRLDNTFLRSLGGGLPTLRSALALRPDGQLALTNMTLDAPLLTLSADGVRRRDGSFHIEGTGRHGRYGPLTLTLDGKIERPTIDVLLARPMDALGLRDVRAHLAPNDGGYAFTAQGGSTLGPFEGDGVLLLPPNAQAIIRVARLAVSGVTARGDIRPVTDGLDGRLDVAGPVTGTVRLTPVRGMQQVALKLDATNASFDGPTLISVRRGKLDATLLLDPAGTSINATAQARGLRIGAVQLGRVALNADLVDGAGKVKSLTFSANWNETKPNPCNGVEVLPSGTVQFAFTAPTASDQSFKMTSTGTVKAEAIASVGVHDGAGRVTINFKRLDAPADARGYTFTQQFPLKAQ